MTGAHGPAAARTARFWAACLVVVAGLATAAGAAAAQTPANQQPQFPSSETGARSVAENTAAGVDVGAPIAATDGDGDSLTYTLGGDDADSFDIVESSGQLRTRSDLDYEARSSYSLTVSVRDGKDSDGSPDAADDDTIDVTVAVTNVDEAGEVRVSPTGLRVGFVLRARLSDPDGGVRSLSWRWASSDDGDRWATEFRQRTSYFTPGDTHAGKHLRVTATYRDAHGRNKQARAVLDGTVADREDAPGLSVHRLVSGLTYPWGIDFTPDGTMLFTQRAGTLSARLPDGTINTVTAEFDDLFAFFEVGLMALLVDPDFDTSRRFYTCQGRDDATAQVIAWTIDDDYTEATRVADPLVGGIPAAVYHSGCRLRFGPEGNLWITTGDAFMTTVPQDLASLGGKVLRVDPVTGAGAAGNPFAASPRVYTYGHRNVQGLALRPGTTQMWIVEHGPAYDDELNLLVPGGNYGWDPGPDYDQSVPMTDLAKYPDAVEAKWSSGDQRLATSGGIFLEGEEWGAWEGRLAVAALKSETLLIFDLAADGALVSEIMVPEFTRRRLRLRTPMLGPDGALYISTSEGSGRDRIFRVTPHQPPEFDGESTTAEVAEDATVGTVVATVAASDPNYDTLTYSLGGPDAASFAVTDTESGGRVTVAAGLDHETQPSLEVELTATDPQAMTDSITLTVEVTDVNEPPTLEGDPSARVPEGTSDPVLVFTAEDPEGDTIMWSVAGDDRGMFAATGGRLRFATAPDFENPADSNGDNVYRIAVWAFDGALADQQDVTVTVDNVDEEGAVRLSSPQPEVDAEFRAVAEDPDLRVENVVWAWERSVDRIAWSVITGVSSASYTPVAADEDRFLRATASYRDGHGPNKTARAESQLAVRAPPPSNDPPEFPTTETGARSVAEDTPAGDAFGSPVEADDTDGDQLAYTLGGPDARSFTIDGSSGRLRVAAALDYETRDTHTVQVTAADPSGESATTTVTISVTDVDEAGELALSAELPRVGEALSATLSDPDDVRAGVVGEWARSADRADWDAISGAEAAQYTPTGADLSRWLRVTATYTDRHGPGRTARAETLDAVQAAPAPVQVAPGGGGGGGGGGGPAPEEAETEAETFEDAGDAGVHEDAVQALAADAIMNGTGCGGGRLCPNQPILRWQMAVWLVRVLDGADPDSRPASRFQDVEAGVWWRPHVERLARLEVTVGCSTEPLNYCPHDPVSRAQMASFLVRAFDFGAADPAGFEDTAGSGHSANIDALLSAGVTRGCGVAPLAYCPERHTTKAQMASFLHRALSQRSN